MLLKTSVKFVISPRWWFSVECFPKSSQSYSFENDVWNLFNMNVAPHQYWITCWNTLCVVYIHSFNPQKLPKLFWIIVACEAVSGSLPTKQNEC